jgi:hypothetical protein
MQVLPTTGKLRLARATPYFNNIVRGAGGVFRRWTPPLRPQAGTLKSRVAPLLMTEAQQGSQQTNEFPNRLLNKPLHLTSGSQI